MSGFTNILLAQGSTGLADPFYANVALLLPFNGSDGDTATVDESPYNHSVGFFGAAQLDNSIQDAYGLGRTAAYFDGSTSFLEIPDSDAFDIMGQFPGAADTAYTIEMWTRFDTSLPTTSAWMGRWNNNLDNGWMLYRSGTSNLLGISQSGADFPLYQQTYALSADVWYHFAFTFVPAPSVQRMYINGVKVFQDLNPTVRVNNSALPFRIGNTNLNTWYHKGWMQDIRLTTGVARYTEDSFTPPTEPFPTQ